MPTPSRYLVTLKDAAKAVGKAPHNVRDYIQRGRLSKYDARGRPIARARHRELRVDLEELIAVIWRAEMGLVKHQQPGLRPELAFFGVPERERTKHVHRLHPYLGKFIPQLVEWFLGHYFVPGEVILDPFMGSGTTLVQANEMRMPAVGIDIAEFNCAIARAKTAVYDLDVLRREVMDAEQRTRRFSARVASTAPAGALPRPRRLTLESAIVALTALADWRSDYLREWYAPRALLEILFYHRRIASGRYRYPELLRVLLSRAARSSRLVPHHDLATPRAPLRPGVPYWCAKHRRACLPTDNAITKIHAYSADTLRRLAAFAACRSEAPITIHQGDARTIDLGELRVNGVFTSPPYVGQIDYHDQHVYAYELFGLPRHDGAEIGRRAKGKSQRARREYVEGIVAAFRNLRRFLAPDARVFVVANDRYDLYPEIARRAGYVIVEDFKRAVTKRTGRSDGPYQETIFRLRVVDEA
ncbi:MAG: hypothetical protein IRY91_13925 [Gemmatimonadaceae bacterium]|nr:hypothetical protein [Gemmatimonadaceae bacterium]